ncbi:hypothetical protein [Zobellia laminariae]|uniref:hypothetical protein n=1 Tax=Zobellia laminariae TaxID=248906 RepID=UPI0026F43417|nr:hypothetical protein [Zobellia laminariae]WKX76368.1 hypothetical protein Q5W13_22940 [Zobellia laminariae]
MKSNLKSIASILFLIFIFFGCKNLNKTQTNEKDELVLGLTNLNNYLKESNKKSNGELFKYLENNANPNIDVIVEKGYVDRTYLLNQKEIIEKEVNSREASDVLKIAESIIDSEFITLDKEQKDGFRFCIWCCRGCMDKIKKNHCITILFWDMGPNC